MDPRRLDPPESLKHIRRLRKPSGESPRRQHSGDSDHHGASSEGSDKTHRRQTIGDGRPRLSLNAPGVTERSPLERHRRYSELPPRGDFRSSPKAALQRQVMGHKVSNPGHRRLGKLKRDLGWWADKLQADHGQDKVSAVATKIQARWRGVQEARKVALIRLIYQEVRDQRNMRVIHGQMSEVAFDVVKAVKKCVKAYKVMCFMKKEDVLKTGRVRRVRARLMAVRAVAALDEFSWQRLRHCVAWIDQLKLDDDGIYTADKAARQVQKAILQRKIRRMKLAHAKNKLGVMYNLNVRAGPIAAAKRAQAREQFRSELKKLRHHVQALKLRGRLEGVSTVQMAEADLAEDPADVLINTIVSAKFPADMAPPKGSTHVEQNQNIDDMAGEHDEKLPALRGLQERLDRLLELEAAEQARDEEVEISGAKAAADAIEVVTGIKVRLPSKWRGDVVSAGARSGSPSGAAPLDSRGTSRIGLPSPRSSVEVDLQGGDDALAFASPVIAFGGGKEHGLESMQKCVAKVELGLSAVWSFQEACRFDIGLVACAHGEEAHELVFLNTPAEGAKVGHVKVRDGDTIVRANTSTKVADILKEIDEQARPYAVELEIGLRNRRHAREVVDVAVPVRLRSWSSVDNDGGEFEADQTVGGRHFGEVASSFSRLLAKSRADGPRSSSEIIVQAMHQTTTSRINLAKPCSRPFSPATASAQQMSKAPVTVVPNIGQADDKATESGLEAGDSLQQWQSLSTKMSTQELSAELPVPVWPFGKEIEAAICDLCADDAKVLLAEFATSADWGLRGLEYKQILAELCDCVGVGGDAEVGRRLWACLLSGALGDDGVGGLGTASQEPLPGTEPMLWCEAMLMIGIAALMPVRSRLTALSGAWCPSNIAASVRRDLSQTDAALGWCAQQCDLLRAANGGGTRVEDGATTSFLKEEKRRLARHRLVGPASARGLYLEAEPRELLRGIEGLWRDRARLLRPMSTRKASRWSAQHRSTELEDGMGRRWGYVGMHPQLEVLNPLGSAVRLENAASEPLPASVLTDIQRQKQFGAGKANSGSRSRGMAADLAAYGHWKQDIRGPGPLQRHLSQGVSRSAFPQPPPGPAPRSGGQVRAPASLRRLCVV